MNFFMNFELTQHIAMLVTIFTLINFLMFCKMNIYLIGILKSSIILKSFFELFHAYYVILVNSLKPFPTNVTLK